MRTIETTLYQFDELTDKAKERALNNCRECNVDHDWWDYIYENEKTKALDRGVVIERIEFSGFHCQGSGAAFKGYVDMSPDQILALLPCDLVARFHAFNAEARLLGCSILYLSPNARVNPTRCLNLSFEHYDAVYWRESNYDYKGPSLDDDYRSITEDMTKAIDSVVEDLCKDIASDIYSALEAEYEYLTSDEAVAETIRTNEREFDADGCLA